MNDFKKHSPLAPTGFLSLSRFTKASYLILYA